MYRVKDLKYANRWVTMQDLSIVKFVNQLAEVPDKFIKRFKDDKDFVIELIKVDKEVPFVKVPVKAEYVPSVTVVKPNVIDKKV